MKITSYHIEVTQNITSGEKKNAGDKQKIRITNICRGWQLVRHAAYFFGVESKWKDDRRHAEETHCKKEKL